MSIKSALIIGPGNLFQSPEQWLALCHLDNNKGSQRWLLMCARGTTFGIMFTKAGRHLFAGIGTRESYMNNKSQRHLHRANPVQYDLTTHTPTVHFQASVHYSSMYGSATKLSGASSLTERDSARRLHCSQKERVATESASGCVCHLSRVECSLPRDKHCIERGRLLLQGESLTSLIRNYGTNTSNHRITPIK